MELMTLHVPSADAMSPDSAVNSSWVEALLRRHAAFSSAPPSAFPCTFPSAFPCAFSCPPPVTTPFAFADLPSSAPSTAPSSIPSSTTTDLALPSLSTISSRPVGMALAIPMGSTAPLLFLSTTIPPSKWSKVPISATASTCPTYVNTA